MGRFAAKCSPRTSAVRTQLDARKVGFSRVAIAPSTAEGSDTAGWLFRLLSVQYIGHDTIDPGLASRKKRDAFTCHRLARPASLKAVDTNDVSTLLVSIIHKQKRLCHLIRWSCISTTCRMASLASCLCSLPAK